jgi:hypothetical protein
MKINFVCTFLSVITAPFLFGQIGINTTTPDPSAALDISQATGKTGGFLPPRVSLQSSTDAVTIPNPANGLLVYNTNAGTSGLLEGVTLNMGTPASPIWMSLVPDEGVTIGKNVYFGATDPGQTLSIGGFEFRYRIEGDWTMLDCRLSKAPPSSVTLSGNRLGWVGTIPGLTVFNKTWIPTDWATWQQLDFMANGASHVFYMRNSVSDRFYKVSSFVSQNQFNSLIVEIY